MKEAKEETIWILLLILALICGGFISHLFWADKVVVTQTINNTEVKFVDRDIYISNFSKREFRDLAIKEFMKESNLKRNDMLECDNKDYKTTEVSVWSLEMPFLLNLQGESDYQVSSAVRLKYQSDEFCYKVVSFKVEFEKGKEPLVIIT